MHIQLQCSKCGEDLTSHAAYEDSDTIIFKIDPCSSFECTAIDPNPEPITVSYLALTSLLKKKEVTVHYRKMNGDLRELTGFLGENDSRTNHNLVYFHELVLEGKAATQVKCLMTNRIISVEHFSDEGRQLTFHIQEAQ